MGDTDKHTNDERNRGEGDTTAEYGEAGVGAGASVGPYKLLRILGEGGFGIVYLAEQQRPVRRQVALKVIKPGMDTKQVIARFEAERQALALLDHPNIAHIFDADTTNAGYPYFVMDHIQGRPITQYCDEERLSIEERLRLFIPVCEAVQHAHQKGIIHRDLKPSNILVTTLEDKAVPVIIDFGIAKALGQPLTERTLFTEQGQLIGTPEYMSPEQAGMMPHDVDTRSDVYSLGVLLYELLTGALPFDPDTLRQAALAEIQRVIREEEPPRPSTRLSSLGEGAKRVAERRRTEATALTRKLALELEWIPLKAMRKERSHRYRTAGELTQDIENYLTGLPLTAGPMSTTYRLRKFVRRHQALMTGAVVVLLTLTGGILVSTLFALGQARARSEAVTARAEADRQALEAQRQAAEARQQAEIAQGVNNFITVDLLLSVDPRRARGHDTTVREALDSASRSVEKKLRDAPIIEAAVRQALGAAYRMLGKWAEAEHHLTRALEIRRVQSGDDHPDTLMLMTLLAAVYHEQGRYAEAEPLLERSLDTRRRVLGEEHRDTLASMYHLSALYRVQGRYAEAEPLLVKTLQIQQRVLGEEHLSTLESMNELALLYTAGRRHPEAEQMHIKALEAKRRALGEDHPSTLASMYNLAGLYRSQKRHAEAESLLVKTLDISRHVLGEEHPHTVSPMYGLGLLYEDQGRYAEAEPLLTGAYEYRRRVLGENHPSVVDIAKSIVGLYDAWHKRAEARIWQTRLDASASVHKLDCVIPDLNVGIPADCQACAANLEKIHAAIAKYRIEKGQLPNWLSDLVPEYLSQEMLLCPDDPTHRSPYSPDPNLPCSYSWELSSDPIPSGQDATRRKIYRDWKMRQAQLFGDVVPVVRCVHHGSKQVLNLSLGGRVYWGPLGWEAMFKKDYRVGDEDRVVRTADPNGESSPTTATVLVREGVARAMGKSAGEVTEEDCRRIKWLDLSRTALSDLQPLRDCVALRKLHLYRTQASDLTPLAGLTSLQELSLSDTQVADLGPLAGLTNLHRLWLDNTSAAGIESLRNLPNLEELVLAHTGVTDLNPLRGLKRLRVLVLTGTKVGSLDALEGLSRLEQLNLQGAPVASLGPLRGLTNLKTLVAPDTQIGTLEPLRDLKNLETLLLSSTPVTDLTPLRNLQKLRPLSLYGTRVTSLEPLLGLANLRTLDIRKTVVTAEEISTLQKALPQLKITKDSAASSK